MVGARQCRDVAAPPVVSDASHDLQAENLREASSFFSFRRTGLALWVILLGGLGSCHNGWGTGYVAGNPPGPLRVFHSPYSDVQWDTDLRLLAQHHDHIAANLSRLTAYDAAGYNVVPLMDYSGVPSLSFTLKKRLWPVESYVTADSIAKFRNIRVLLPSAEEVGISTRHVTSPFLTDYIEYGIGGVNAAPVPQYSSLTELAYVIRVHGGLPIVAHPWYSSVELLGAGSDIFGMEIYSAYIAAKTLAGEPDFVAEDLNKKLLANWDTVLSTGRLWVGIAVNDHFGPYALLGSTDPGVRDSGKILVLSRAASLEGYRDAFERGAFFAIRDNGITKGSYPKINRISVQADSVTVDAENAVAVRWISMGQLVGSSAQLPYSALPGGAVYVRAEVLGEGQTVVFTQPFVLRHIDDTNGDGYIDASDDEACAAVAAGAEQDPDIGAACAQ